MFELLDIFNDNMEYVGVATRSVAHAQGLWHQTFHCWIIREDTNGQYVLFQRRGPEKKLYPNTLDITAAGHLQAGESPEDGIREAEEELGVKVDFEALIPLGVRSEVVQVGAIINREFCHTYLWHNNASLETYKLHPDEVTGLVQMRLEDGLMLFAGKRDKVLVEGYQVDPQGHKRRIQISVGFEDIIPRKDRYYLKIFIMAERYFRGCSSEYLAI